MDLGDNERDPVHCILASLKRHPPQQVMGLVREPAAEILAKFKAGNIGQVSLDCTETLPVRVSSTCSKNCICFEAVCFSDSRVGRGFRVRIRVSKSSRQVSIPERL